MIETKVLQRQVRHLLMAFMAGLILSGVTAFPLEWELRIAHQWFQAQDWNNDLACWVDAVYHGVAETNANYPFIAYGTDWLAFAHLVIAVAFIGPLRDPVRNIWVIEFGLIACAAIFPLAFIAGSMRGIPFYWQLIDCSFGVSGGGLLWICYRKVKRMEVISYRLALQIRRTKA
ncbi:MAG TPA: hypothetical protein VD816_18240 [Ohtaekwangia sp.]|nr:hypothetical protein [Ohtaekwangia sp.]